MDLVGVIMAGGAGTRFWPLSTAQRPKQFLRLVDEESLLQKSFLRLAGLIDRERILVLTNEAFVPLVREQLPQVPAHNVVGEPLRRDTAAAVCLAATLVRKRFGNSVIATVTADHLIEPVDEFRGSLISAARGAADSRALYTFGIRPTSPATAYGYLELGEPLDLDPDVQHFRIASFREKPDLELAREYVASGNYFWNSGCSSGRLKPSFASWKRTCRFTSGTSRPPSRVSGPMPGPRHWWPVSIHSSRSPSTLR